MVRFISILIVLGFILLPEQIRAEGLVKTYKSKNSRTPTYVIQSSGDKARTASSLFSNPVVKVDNNCDESHFLMRGVCKAWLGLSR